ncbi:sialoglycan-binding domain-containing protein, partial [Streptococcus pluranimalium]|uniref:sialoglycan-binding domain-containing protein n=1 Tax=Streptococcus pluranimalium TaxID=82348 RepID=UPI0039E8CD8A
ASVLLGALLLLGQGTVSASENTASSVELAPGNLSQEDSASGETPIASIEKEESANQTFQEPSVEPQSPATVSVDADNRGYSAIAEETGDLAENDSASTQDDLDGDGFSNDAEDVADSDKNDAAPISDRLVSDVSDSEILDTKTPASLYTTRSAADIETRSAEKRATHKESINEYYVYDDSAFTYQGGETLFGDGSAQYIPKLYKANANDGVFHVGFNEDDRSVIFTYLFNPHNETWGFGANVYAFLPGDDVIDPNTLVVSYKKFASARASNGAYTIQDQWEKLAFASDFDTVSRNIVNRDDQRFENDFNINVEEKETLEALKPRLGYRFWSKEVGGNSSVLYQFKAKVRDNVKSEDIDFLVGNRNLLNANRASQAWFARSGTFDYDKDGYSDLEEIRRKSNPKDINSIPDDQRPVVTGNKEVIVYRGERFEDTSMKVTDNSGKIVSLSTDRGGVSEGSGLNWLKVSQDNLGVEGNATTERPYTVKLSGEVPKEMELKDGEARFTHYLTAKDTAGNQSTDNDRKPGSPGEFVIVVKPQTDKYHPELTNQTPVSTTVGTPVDTQAILDKVTVPGKDDV